MKTLKSVVAVCFFVLCGLWLSGCSRLPDVPNIVEIQSKPDGTVSSNPIIHNRKLDRIISVVNCNGRMVGNILQVNSTVQNHVAGKVAIAYRYQWYDQNDSPVDSALSETWMNEWIEGGDAKTLMGMGASVKAVRARLLIKLAD